MKLKTALAIAILLIPGITFTQDYYCLDVLGFSIGTGFTLPVDVPFLSGLTMLKLGYISPDMGIGFGCSLEQNYGRDSKNDKHYGEVYVSPVYLYILLKQNYKIETTVTTEDNKQVKGDKIVDKPTYIYLGGGLGGAQDPISPNSKIYEFGVAGPILLRDLCETKIGLLYFSCDAYDYEGKHSDAVEYLGAYITLDFYLGWNWRIL